MKIGNLRKRFVQRANRKSKVGMKLTRLGQIFKMKKYTA